MEGALSAEDSLPCNNPQQCLYFLPLPHGHGSFLPRLLIICRDTVLKNTGFAENRSWLGISFYLKALGCSCRCEFIRTQSVVRANKFAPTSMATAVFIRFCRSRAGGNPVKSISWMTVPRNSPQAVRFPACAGITNFQKCPKVRTYWGLVCQGRGKF